MNRNSSLAVLAAMAVTVAAGGCKSDLNQQLLERELRMQEDQIYQLQDELQDKCFRLSRSSGENTSLRKQLGIVDADASLPSRLNVPPGVALPAVLPPALLAPSVALPAPVAPARPSVVTPRVLVPPAINLPEPSQSSPEGLRFGPSRDVPAEPSMPEDLTPPALDGVPPLSEEARARGAVVPAVQRLSYEESLADGGSITHLVINPLRSECFDGDGDGVSEGLAVVFEPRDADERLVTAAGDVSIMVLNSTASHETCQARWDIPAQEAIEHFRRTSRARGLHFVLRWPAQPPPPGQMRLLVRMTTFDGQVFETEGTLAVR